jgi:hypothetical protein
LKRTVARTKRDVPFWQRFPPLSPSPLVARRVSRRALAESLDGCRSLSWSLALASDSPPSGWMQSAEERGERSELRRSAMRLFLFFVACRSFRFSLALMALVMQVRNHRREGHTVSTHNLSAPGSRPNQYAQQRRRQRILLSVFHRCFRDEARRRAFFRNALPR